MSILNKEQLKQHIGHKIVIANYGESVCVECETCNEVLYCEEDLTN